ncbi:hypothetical protein CCP4SC76_440002 [Gammaproteobacteria bacterium]
MKPSNFTYLAHGNHLNHACSKNEQESLITLVNFRRAEPLKSGQFSSRINIRQLKGIDGGPE